MVDPVIVIAGDVIANQPAQMLFVQSDDVIEHLAAAASDPPFGDSVGEGRQLHHDDHGDTTFEVIHPYHPLRGQKFKLVTYRNNWGEDRVYFHHADGRLGSIPASWTTVVAPDPFVVVAGGRCLFRYEDLLQLVELMEKLR